LILCWRPLERVPLFADRTEPVCLLSVSHQVFRVHPSGDKYAWARGNTAIALPGRRILRQRARQNLEGVVSLRRQLVVDVRHNFGPRINEILVWLAGLLSVDRHKKTHSDRYRQEDTGEFAIGFTHAVVRAFSRQRHPRRNVGFDSIKPKVGGCPILLQPYREFAHLICRTHRGSPAGRIENALGHSCFHW
jgi:hypothetical protein